jgi:lysocardiolipin and lysophospholipid acyltransferase
MELADFIFLKRKWEFDRPHLIQTLNTLVDHFPLLLLIFPEGTIVSEITLQNANEYRKTRYLPPLFHSLHPKSNGLFAMLQCMGQKLDGIYDLTMAFKPFPEIFNQPNDVFGIFNSFFRLKFPKEVHYFVDYIPRSEIPSETSEDLRNWLVAQFYMKEKKIESFYQRGSFDAKLIYKGPMLLAYSLITWIFLVLSTAFTSFICYILFNLL